MADWGVYDKANACWIGSEAGPFTYPNSMLARAAATLLSERLGEPTRLSARPYLQKANHLKDTLTPPHTIEEAWKKLKGA